MQKLSLLVLIMMLCINNFINAQSKKVEVPNTLSTEVANGFKFRSIGPALMSGRISDIAIHPTKPSTWYVTAGSGGVWKTENAGNTWTPIFDEYKSFSIGCVTIDPSVHSTIWVGTGENVGGRHMGFGDGIYRSMDEGKTFTNMGLKQSEHISKIVVHPSNSNVVLVAAQGPLWSKGGERGVFKTIDGGQNWKQVLGDKEWVGATDIVVDPRDANVMYAATWQRHRTIAAYMGGGPGTALYKSTNGGDTWQKLTSGLPTSNMGKIGLAISPQKPDVVYAAIELDRRTGGVYRSDNGGASWSKMSDAVSGATGPHYYQELVASPHQFDKLYLLDVRVQVSEDGGKTFTQMKEEHKHSDNHAMAFIKDRPDFLLVGTDGGLYESNDNTANWKFFANLPLTQFYDIAIDDTEPFYKVYGGTQDNSTQGGPSQTDKVQGISNGDWSVVLDWDGHQPATEPGNPNIIYGQRQQGTLARIDMKTGEVTDIQPAPAEGENYERFNWDAPIIVSSHDPKQLFFASQRLWRSNDRGDSWMALSGDLTRNQDRFALPIMGSTQSADNAWDVLAMSNFNTITTVAESPKQRDLIYIGTDDGLVQITEDGGKNWRKMEVSMLPGCPSVAYVNEIKADLYDANTAYITLDNHKSGDYQPYIYKTNDKGKTWRSMRGNFPDTNFIWRIIQDHIKPELFFVASEFGIYVTINGGSSWSKMGGGLPTISFRDLKIHQKENDLVAASFGRGIYILDDYSALRTLNDGVMSGEAKLFPIADAKWYVPRSNIGFEGAKGDQGAGYFTTPNPEFGAHIRMYLKDDIKSLKEIRKEKEKKAVDAKQAVAFTSWEDLRKEENEVAPSILISISDASGTIIKKLSAPAKKGIQTVAWDLRYPSSDAISSSVQVVAPGFLVAPGTYKAAISKVVNGVVTPLSEAQSFEVKPLYQNTLTQMSYAEVASFWRTYEKTSGEASKMNLMVQNTKKYADALMLALSKSSLPSAEHLTTLQSAATKMNGLAEMLNGNELKNQVGAKNNPTITSRLFDVSRGVGLATYGPTKTNVASLAIVAKQLASLKQSLTAEQNVLSQIADKIMKAGGPFVEKGW